MDIDKAETLELERVKRPSDYVIDKLKKKLSESEIDKLYGLYTVVKENHDGSVDIVMRNVKLTHLHRETKFREAYRSSNKKGG